MFSKPSIRISPRRFILLALDALVVAGSLILAAVIRLGPARGLAYVQHHQFSLFLSGLLFLIVFYGSGLYEREPLLRRKREAFRLPLIATLFGCALTIVLFYARAAAGIGRGILVIAGGLIFLGCWSARLLYRVGIGYGLLSKNVLIVGEGHEAVQVLRLLANSSDAGYKVFGIVSSTKTRYGEFLEGVPILGHMSRIHEFVDAYAIETIIVATSLSREHSLLRLLRPLRYAGVEIMDYVTLHEVLAQEIPIDHIDDEWLMSAAMNSSVIHIRKIKRAMDLVVAVVGLIVTLPICLITVVAIKLESRGPVLYQQRRAGQRDRTYTLLKFRTMKQDAEVHTGPVWADKYDQRITRIGRFLRKVRIDEIPQLINVLRGEMSLVGPRPERPEFVETLSGAIPFYRERLLVPPGITGWAQIKYPYAASIEASRRKLQYDLYYIKHMSFSLDLLILLRTFKTIVVGLRHSEELEPHVEPARQVLPLTDRPAERPAKWA